MKRMMVVAAVLVGLTGAALGQVSPEEAQRRLDAKQADVAAMRVELDKLRREVVVLRQKVADLQSANAELRQKSGVATNGPAAKVATATTAPAGLRIGMTLAEAKQACAQWWGEARLAGAVEDGIEYYEWQGLAGRPDRSATFHNGKLVSYSE